MLEVLYDTATLAVIAWNGDASAQGNFEPTPGQDVVLLPVDPPEAPMDDYRLDLVALTIVGTPPVPDQDTARAIAILATSSANISMPEIWELLRIIGKRLGWYRPD